MTLLVARLGLHVFCGSPTGGPTGPNTIPRPREQTQWTGCVPGKSGRCCSTPWRDFQQDPRVVAREGFRNAAAAQAPAVVRSEADRRQQPIAGVLSVLSRGAFPTSTRGRSLPAGGVRTATAAAGPPCWSAGSACPGAGPSARLCALPEVDGAMGSPGRSRPRPQPRPRTPALGARAEPRSAPPRTLRLLNRTHAPALCACTPRRRPPPSFGLRMRAPRPH